MAVEALTSSVLRNLTPAAIDLLGGALCVRNQLQKLRRELSAIQAVIHDAEDRSMTERHVRDWLDKLKDVAYDVDDLLDEFQTDDGWRNQDTTTVWQKVRIFLSPSNPLVFRIKMSFEIKGIVEKMDMISQERTRYQLRVDPPYETRQHQMESRMTAAAINETNNVYGRDDEVNQILSLMLEKGIDKEEELSVVTIFGLGGFGKTTLAQQVYKHERVVKEKFDRRIWVCVSDPFDVRRIANTIIESIDGRCDLLQFEPTVERMQHVLTNKRFLLVLDDVWNENEQEWEKLKGFLAVGSKGSKILVTTRSFKIASMMGTPYCLGVLSEDACWRLFEERAFRAENVQRDMSLEAIGREIVVKCRGSPLAAKSMGSLMRFKTGRREWLAVTDSDIWRSTNEGNQIMASLRLSYNHLSPHLKQCFAYCSIFPKDSSIRRDELVLHWIALGFIPSNISSESAVNKGNDYFNSLVWISFLDEDSTTHGVRQYYKMHDLVHDLAKSVAGDEQFICYADQKAIIPPRCRFCTLVGSWKEQELKHLFRESSEVRALRLQGSNIINGPILFTSLPRRLRVLDLGRSPIKEVHASINRLQHLRYLRLHGSYVSELPNSIGRLRNLFILRAPYCSLKSLPQSFTSLQNLQTLDLPHCDRLVSLPESLESLQGLQILNLSFCTKLISLPESIGKLAKLRSLQLHQCHDFHSLPQSLGNLSNLEELDLDKCTSIVELPESIGRLDKLRTLQLSLCQALRSLPQSLGNLSNLEELDLQECSKIDELPDGMGNMTSLRYLRNWGMCSLRGMPFDIGKLRNLVTLQLFAVGEDINHGSIAEMQHLNLIEGELVLTHLENVKRPGDAARANMKEKHRLKELDLRWYDDILSLRWYDVIPYDPCSIHEEVLTDLIPHPNLKELKVMRYPGINFPNRVRMMSASLPNLVEITLNGLKCLPSFSGSLLQLEKLCIWEMLDVEKWLVVADGVELYPRLRMLQIIHCPNLARIPKWLRELTSLEDLHILLCSSSLEERCKKDTGEDWPIIAHIPSIRISRSV